MRKIPSSASRRLRLIDYHVQGIYTPSIAHRGTSTLRHRSVPVPRPPLLRDEAAAIPGSWFRCHPNWEGKLKTLSPRHHCRRPSFYGNPNPPQRSFSSASNGKGGGKDVPKAPGKITPPDKPTRNETSATPKSSPAPAPSPAPETFSRGGATRTGSEGKRGGGLGSTAGSLPHQVSEFYADMERNLMSRMRAQDKGRFRALSLSSLLLFVWVLSMFGTEIRRYFASQTAEVARETLKVQALQIQTQELATALVQALLNDQEVVGAGALFLREASTNPETQAALISLALFILQHPETLDETIVLAKKLVQAILDDPESVQQVTSLALKVIADERFKAGATQLVVELGQSDQVFEAVSKLTSRVIQHPEVQASLSEVLAASSHEVLEDPEVLDHSKEFVAQVIGDDAVQRSGGDALWNTVQYAFQTRVMRIAGVCLLAGSAVLLSGRVGAGGNDRRP
ncbi:unnamed protein product [Ascophyllum nodosum]